MKYLLGFTVIFAYNVILFRILLSKNENSDVYFLTSLFGNTGYLGYPVLGAAFGNPGITFGVIYSFVSVTLVNTFGIAFLMKDVKKSVHNLLKLPFVYSIVTGMTLGYLGVNWKNFPAPLSLAIGDIKEAAIPVIMVFLGYSLSKVRLSKRNIQTMSLATLHRLFAIPLLALLISYLIGLKGIERSVFVVESAMPTAMNVVVISAALKKKPDLMSSVVALSTALSAITLSVWIYFLR
jgi:predicted permease